MMAKVYNGDFNYVSSNQNYINMTHWGTFVDYQPLKIKFFRDSVIVGSRKYETNPSEQFAIESLDTNYIVVRFETKDFMELLFYIGKNMIPERLVITTGGIAVAYKRE